jgi:phosphopantothenate-cysteine ligase
VLITAGGTIEKIDAVRSISNTGTGRLGSIIADCFAASNHVERVLYIAGKNAMLPATQKATVFRIEGTRDLEQTVRDVTREYAIDAVIHSMAVSDYCVARVSTVEHIARSVLETMNAGSNENALERITRAVRSAQTLDTSKKISSSEPDMALFLEQTPKIISLFSSLTPNALLVGFKLLDGVPHDELIDTAYALLTKNNCAYVLANDVRDIAGDAHTGYMVARGKNVIRYTTKQDIARGIAAHILDALKERTP